MHASKFKKEEKLCSQKIIDEIFLHGSTFFCYPLKVAWLFPEEPFSSYPAQAAFSVPKKKIKKAHSRNEIKRLMRESYRIRKNDLYDALILYGKRIAMMLIYVGREEPQFSQIESAIKNVIDHFRLEIINK